MVVCSYLERDNEKVLKFHVNNPSFFLNKHHTFEASLSDKHCPLKL